jgi:predicted PolB exonuclease-like 3'-5' exonuclease
MLLKYLSQTKAARPISFLMVCNFEQHIGHQDQINRFFFNLINHSLILFLCKRLMARYISQQNYNSIISS